MAKAKEPRSDEIRNSDFGHEIWGLVYIAIAVFVLVSLISHFANHGANILGPYLGSALATGMVFLFGPVPVFFFPAAIGFIGWLRLRGDQISTRSLILQAVLTVEICVLLATHTLPLVAAGKIHGVDSNWIGMAFIRMME